MWATEPHTHNDPAAPQGRPAMHDDREHVISVVLNHEEWKEFVKIQPRPVDWLRERIVEMIAAARETADQKSSVRVA